MEAYNVVKVFFITPRHAGRYMQEMEAYVNELEKTRHVVYWPLRDDDGACKTDDVIAMRRHIAQIGTADEVHVWYYDLSQSVMFALGIAAALRKPVVVKDGPGRRNEMSRLRRVVGRWDEVIGG